MLMYANVANVCKCMQMYANVVNVANICKCMQMYANVVNVVNVDKCMQMYLVFGFMKIILFLSNFCVTHVPEYDPPFCCQLS